VWWWGVGRAFQRVCARALRAQLARRALRLRRRLRARAAAGRSARAHAHARRKEACSPEALLCVCARVVPAAAARAARACSDASAARATASASAPVSAAAWRQASAMSPSLPLPLARAHCTRCPRCTRGATTHAAFRAPPAAASRARPGGCAALALLLGGRAFGGRRWPAVAALCLAFVTHTTAGGQSAKKWAKMFRLFSSDVPAARPAAAAHQAPPAPPTRAKASRRRERVTPGSRAAA
jgi:hypothetical protein